jgi:hypothetical protein
MDGVIEYEYTESNREGATAAVPSAPAPSVAHSATPSPVPLPVPETEETVHEETENVVEEEEGIYEDDEEAEVIYEAVPEDVPEDLDILATFCQDAETVYTRFKENHMDYFLAGTLLVTHFPILGWLLTSYAFTVPTLVAVQSLKWIDNKEVNILHVMTIIAFTTASQTYAIYCVTRAMSLTDASINSHLLV